MSLSAWPPFILASLSILGLVVGGIRFLVKHYFAEMKAEFKPNGGGSMKDQITRLEMRVNDADQIRRDMNKKIDMMYEILLEHVAKDK